MKRVPPIFSSTPAQAQTLLRWALGLLVLPLALFVAVAMLQAQPSPQVLALREAELWQETLGHACVIALVMMLVSLQLALGRWREPVFTLLTANALVWALVNLPYFYDFTGQDTLSAWFGAAVDVSINWSMVLTALLLFEFERIQVPRLRVGLVLYGCLSTLLTLPLWHWEKNALLAQSYLNMAVYLVSNLVLAWHVARAPSREGVVLCVAFAVQLALVLHDVLFLTSQIEPDHVYTHPFSMVAMFLALMYAIIRRTVRALDTSERHQAELEAQLAEQQQRLALQHARVQRLEIENRLAAQRNALMQDLTDELRNLNQPMAPDQCNLNTTLAELRQRVQHRLVHGGIQLVWAVDPGLPVIQRAGAAVALHLRALLNEAIANVIKHAQATQICVSAQVLGEQVRIEITDNGCGFSPGLSEPGRGLPGMRERARLLDARLYIDAGEGPGCRWRLELPWAAVTRG